MIIKRYLNLTFTEEEYQKVSDYAKSQCLPVHTAVKRLVLLCANEGDDEEENDSLPR